MTSNVLTVKVPDRDESFRIYSTNEPMSPEQLSDLINILTDSRMLVSAAFSLLGEVWVYKATNADWTDVQRAVKCFWTVICGWFDWDVEILEIPRKRSLILTSPPLHHPKGLRILNYVPMP